MAGNDGYPGRDTLSRLRGGGGAPVETNGYPGRATLARLHGQQPATQKKSSGHGSSGGGVGGFFKRFGSDLLNAAEQSPGAVAHLTADAARTVKDTSPFVSKAKRDKGGPLLGDVKQIAKGTAETLKHPLRHPGDFALTIAPAFGAVGKAAEAGAVAKAGGSAAEVGRTLVKGAKGPRELNVNGMKVRGHYSRAAGSRVAQKATDAGLQKLATRPNRAGLAAENVLHKRAAKFMGRNERVNDAQARQAGTIVQKLGEKLKPEEQRALRLVAEEVPVERRLGAQEMRKARASTAKETARHQERIDLTRKAQQFLTTDAQGKPVFKPEATKLRNVYTALKKASGDRETMLKNLGLMDEGAQQAAKTKVARVAAGGKTELDTLGTRFAKTPERYKLQFAENLVGRYVKAADRANYGKVLSVDAEKGTARVHFHNKEQNAKATVDMPLDRLTNPRGKSRHMVGANDITASPNATFIGNPVERGRLRGKPKVSSGGTFGHTSKPSSLKTSTGGSVEHALERQDVTNIVAERHSEAVRISKIQRVAQTVAKAGEKAPRRKDDVWVWTNKTVSNERIPKEVRQYLDNPESLHSLPPDEQHSIMDKVREAHFQTEDWRDPAKLAEFEKLAQKGKGVFVPRRLLGQFAKREDITLPGTKFIDAVNNAQKAGLVYLKVNYPIIQSLSNTAMNLIQQGPFAVKNLTNAVKLDRKVGPEYAAVIDDVMGQGAVLQATFEGQGGIARATQKVGHIMSSKVDTPARRAAFLHEASKLGYKTPDQLVGLLTDEQKVGDLYEVAQKAKEAIVDYGDLSPFERSVVRRLVFVYPWQKGATKYAAHFFRDHPVQAAALAQLGQQGAQQSDTKLGPVPSYLRGVFDVNGGLVNPAGVNFFQTPAQIGEAVAGTATGNPAQAGSFQGFLAPAPGLIVAALTGRDDIGRPLSGNLASNAYDLTAGSTPLIQAAAAALGHPRTSKTFPGANDAIYRLILGGLHPRQYDKNVLNQNAAFQKTGR